RLFTNADSDSPVIAGYAVDTLGFKKIAILYVDELFGHSYRDVFTRIVKEKGGEVVVVEAITYTEWDYSTQLLKVKQAQPDALYIIGIENQITNAMDQMDVLDILDIPLLAVGTIATPNGVAAMTKHETQAFTSAFCLDAMPGDYIGKFMTKYEKFPGFFSTFGYDSVMLIKDAVSRRGTGHQGIRDGLATVQDFESTVGTVSVDAQGEMAFPMCPKQVSEKGILNLVSGNYYDLG
ncbi:MAG: ABC transporter substrate-binding protein, partial [Candidatus Woesearchaeota archaeon]|nr:ABC transporter substrate-binding protein [Candidatus Woesearchaeota archaeon]